MKKIIVLLTFTLISMNIYSQTLSSSTDRTDNSMEQGNEGEINLDQPQNENRNQNLQRYPAHQENTSGAEQGVPELKQKIINQNFTHFIGGRIGFGYNALCNPKSAYNKDSAAVLLGLNYTVFLLKFSDTLRFGLSFNFSLNVWAGTTRDEETVFYTYEYHTIPNYLAFEISVMPMIKYKKFLFGFGMYFCLTSTTWKLYKETSNTDEGYTRYIIDVYSNPKVKKHDYGIATMIGFIHRGAEIAVMVGLELKFSINKPVLYYDYYATGTFPYTERGEFRGDGNYFTLLFFFTIGGAW